MRSNSTPSNYRCGYHFSNAIAGYLGWTPPNECREHYLSTDHYSVHKITGVTAEELPFARAAPENGQKEEFQIEMGP